MKTLETERLIICKLTLDDAEFILELLNTPAWLQFIGDRNVKNNEDACNYIANGPMKSYEKNGFGLCLVKLKNETPIGICGLIKRETLQDVDIGFALLPYYEGMGYGTEGAQATLNFAKTDLGLKRIVAITDAENINSIHLLEKSRFVFEKMVKLSEEEKEIMLFAAVI
ncbi:MAG: GNAT family N-acetyltransferase [Bacteroidia bacterium]